MASSAQSFEADLRAAREAADVSIEDIHQETRLAADIIKRFEEGKLVSDPSFNAIYLKAFLRSYAEAVGLSANKVEKSWEALQVGAYGGELHPNFESGDDWAVSEDSGNADGDPAAQEEDAPKKESLFPKVDPLPPATPTTTAFSSVPKTVPFSASKPTRRLQKKVRKSSGKSFDSAWGAILGVTVLVVLAVFAVLWLLFRDNSPTPDVVNAASTDSIEVATADNTIGGQQSEAPLLTFPIEVQVVAGGDGLQSFRVTEIPDERRPIWVEPGETVSFTSDRGVVLWGEGAVGMDPAEVTLRFRGYEWHPPQGQILRIDGTYGQTLLDSLHRVFPNGGNARSQP